MILFNDQTLFVHNPKTAGTSLLSYLQTALRGTVRTAGVHQLGTHHPSLSMAHGYACAVTGQAKFERIVAVMRNPFDREISMYVYFREVLSRSPNIIVDLPDAAMRKRVCKTTELSFRQYLAWLWATEGTVDVYRSQYFYRFAEGDMPDAMQIARFEHLASDLGRILGIRKVRLPRLNGSCRDRDVQFYDKKTADLVRRSYRWVFEAGHYDDKLV